MTALQCLCDLLKNVPHFNFRTNIMAVLVPKMNDDSTDEQVSCAKNKDFTIIAWIYNTVGRFQQALNSSSGQRREFI